MPEPTSTTTAAVATVLAAGVLLLAVPGTRDVTADFFGRARPHDDDNTTADGGPQA